MHKKLTTFSLSTSPPPAEHPEEEEEEAKNTSGDRTCTPFSLQNGSSAAQIWRPP